MKAVFEVGFNTGKDTDRLLKTYDCHYFGFEPVPELFEEVLGRYKRMKNVHFFNKAVDVEEGIRKFNITPLVPGINARYGASSLHSFDDSLRDKWNRPDFEVDRVIDVECVRLESVIRKCKVSEIEYLHCDAQGNDLNVLKSLGEYVNIVKAGVIEADLEFSLYSDTDNHIKTALGWLEQNGFRATRIDANDRFNAEINIHFER